MKKINREVMQKIIDLTGRNNLQLSYLICVAISELNDRIDEAQGEMESKYGTHLFEIVEKLNDRHRNQANQRQDCGAHS
jgi:uncharacterized coiled-coil protein SlyX